METVDIAVKRCSKCGEVKPLGEFYKDKTKASGLRSHCKVCVAEYTRDHYELHRIAEIARASKHRLENPEYYREYRRKNHDRIARRDSERRRKNHERILQHAAEYRRSNPDRVRTANAKYRCKNRDKYRVCGATRRARERNAEGTHTRAEMREQFTRQRGICYYCDHKLIHPFQTKPKTTTKRVAHWEHIVPLDKGGRNDLSNLVWTCAKCNLSKGTKLLGIEWKAPNGKLI